MTARGAVDRLFIVAVALLWRIVLDEMPSIFTRIFGIDDCGSVVWFLDVIVTRDRKIDHAGIIVVHMCNRCGGMRAVRLDIVHMQSFIQIFHDCLRFFTIVSHFHLLPIAQHSTRRGLVLSPDATEEEIVSKASDALELYVAHMGKTFLNSQNLCGMGETVTRLVTPFTAQSLDEEELPFAQVRGLVREIAEVLKHQPNTPQGRRDALLVCLFLDHGLRVGEIAILTRKAFDMKAGTLAFYRPKVNKTQTHELTADTRRAASAYLKYDAPQDGISWRRSCKGTGKLSSQMSETSATRALTKRVELLGRHAGIEGLSAHDGRHFWATYEARNNTPVNRLMDAGGWSSPAMPLRYIEAAHIANEGTARVKQT